MTHLSHGLLSGTEKGMLINMFQLRHKMVCLVIVIFVNHGSELIVDAGVR